MAETFCLLPDGEPRNKTPIICHRRSIRWPRLHHRKGWCLPSWTFKGITNKMLNYGLRRLKTGEKAIFYHAVWAKQPHFMTETYPVSHHTIQWRLCHRNGWSFPFWTSKGTTNKMLQLWSPTTKNRRKGYIFIMLWRRIRHILWQRLILSPLHTIQWKKSVPESFLLADSMTETLHWFFMGLS